MLFEIDAGEHTWLCVYDKAIRDDGSLLFPERLTKSFLAEQRKTLGPYIFANQYMNEIIPAEDQDFKKSWIKYYETKPQLFNSFVFVDPAISQQENADYTAYVVVHVDHEGFWYVETARRMRINATDTVRLVFRLAEMYKPMVIGIEDVGYQRSLFHFINEEMRRKGSFIPITGVKRGPDKSKEQRILSLVPRFEMGNIFMKRGLTDLEDEYSKFPRGRFDDIMDALASIEEIAFSPTEEKGVEREPSPNSPEYERWYIQQVQKDASWESSEDY